MDKEKFIEELVKRTGLTKEQCTNINSIFEDNFIIGKKNKEKTIAAIMEAFGKTEEEADEIYNIAAEIIATNIKEKLKHPFRSKD